MNEQEFTPGDLVRLKSGGPIMTYSGNDFAGRAICIWFYGAKHESYCFSLSTLEQAKKCFSE